MKTKQLRSQIEALEAKIAQATPNVIEEQQLTPDTILAPLSGTLALPTQIQEGENSQQNASVCGTAGIKTTILENNDSETVLEIYILTRPLKSLKYAKSIIPSSFYPSFSMKYGITHWAVEVGDRVFEVRTEGWKGKGGKMKIPEQDNTRAEYHAENVDRHRIGIGSSSSVAAFRQMSVTMQRSDLPKYNFYYYNCQLIAAAMAVAGCQQPSDGWNALIQREDLRFFNRDNFGHLLKMVGELLPEVDYHRFLVDVESGYNEMEQQRHRAIYRALAHNTLTITAEYLVFCLMWPIEAALLVMEGLVELAEEHQQNKSRKSQSRPPWPKDLFGIQVRDHRSPVNLQSQWSPRDRSSSRRRNTPPPIYEARPRTPPSYYAVEWRNGESENDNDQWICAMYGYGPRL